MRRLATFAVVLALAFAGSLSVAAPMPVALGEVSTALAKREVDEAWLRTTLIQELGGLDLSRVPKGKHAILSVSLVRMEALSTRGNSSIVCVVSATLRDAKKGTVFAVLEGQARAETGAIRVETERAALRSAVHGAIAGIPGAMR